MTLTHLPFDLLLRIFEELVGSNHLELLYSCALVSHEFNTIASKLLYKKVALSPAFTNTVDLRKRSQELSGQFLSACLPHNSPFVLELIVSRYLLARSAPLNTFAQTLRNAIQQWPNLKSITLNPETYPPDLMATVLPQLLNCAHLSELTVGRACSDEALSPLLAQVSGLDALTIRDPTRAILQLLPDWLGRLRDTLSRLTLQNNCGSVTPGVLRSLVAPLVNIHSFELGLSYSLTNDDIFASLNELTSLQELQLHYYMQLRAPSLRAHLPALRCFTVRHQAITTRREVSYFSRWIRLIVSHSPLEKLCIIDDTDPSRFGRIPVSFDGVIDHLRSKHHGTLRVVRMDKAYVRHRVLHQMLEACPHLEELGIGIHACLLPRIPEFFDPCGHLRTMILLTPMLRYSRVKIDNKEATRFMSSRSHNVYRLSVNKARWEGSWVSDPTGNVRFIVGKVEDTGRKIS